jgi:ribosomal protein S27E
VLDPCCGDGAILDVAAKSFDLGCPGAGGGLMCSCDFEEADLVVSTRRRARTQHSCIECGSVILPGDPYVHVAYKADASFDAHSECSDCNATSIEFTRAQVRECGCCGWEFGRMWDEIAEFCQEHLYYDPETGAELPRPRSTSNKPGLFVEASP